MKLVLILFMAIVPAIVRAQQSKPIIVQNAYFPKAGKEKEVYEWRLLPIIIGTDVREKLGLPKGRVLRRVSEGSGSYVIWQCDYTSMEERKKDVELLDRSEEFKKVQEHMSSLIDKFERTVWEVN